MRDFSLICPRNDGEALAIVRIARSIGGIDVRASAQPWGATLDKEPKENLENLRKVVVIVEIPSIEKEEELRQKGHEVIVIDHHNYISMGLDRSNTLSSLEQFAELAAIELTREEMGMAINDRGYIHGLIDSGYTNDEILKIRRYDLGAQGATAEDFALCLGALEEGKMYNGVMVVNLGDANPSYVVDMYTLENPEVVRDILVCRNADIRFFGSPEKAKALSALGGWFGGGDRSKFWGSDKCDRKDVFSILGIRRSR